MDMEELHKKPPYGMIAILFFGAFVAFLNNTLLNVALPTIMAEFNVKPAVVQWLTNGYMLVNGILIPASAFFIQRFTNRNLFLTAMSLFTIGTAFAAFAPSFGFLIAGRMIQASGAGMMMPLLMNVMLTAFPVERRGTAMGMFGLVIMAAPAIGPTLSGWVVEHYDWRTLFRIILPFAVITLIFALFKLKNITPTRDIKVNIFSLILSSIGFGSLLYGFSTAGDKGWDVPEVYGTIVIGVIALIIFVVRQLKMEDPMLEFRIYKYPMFALSSVIMVVVSASMFSGMILTPIYVQTIREISPFHAGLLMLPGAILMAIMSPVTGRLFDKYGARILAAIGLTVTVITTYLFSRLTADTGFYHIMFLYTIRMFGMSLVMMPVMTNGLNQLPMSANPHGTAMNNTLQQISGAIGTAVLITIMNKRMEASGAELAEKAAASGNAPATPEALKELSQQAMLDGITHTFLISTYIAAVALVLAMFMKRVTPPKTDKALAKKFKTQTE
ncbi:DHA2 family efflux MFS transporter permease subunit [Siminovitchia fortis]|uniref:DHA2 family efflux MFS transporter permease subunit n=1 Tax=Siminovitchia fortis TaxID=254758 RepID=A0A443IPS5_9BACI|nr:DHA2 family efflux MFS transporter permease subunit [Siminovitchia fortis]RWR07829.1 DHA2 family efflux MFS transporter permease subunit [Siminovitchia fortis]WHY80548.1 DHA2 family efflux MFS transporter permease subunit [Siminovitchia fortis]